MQDKPTSTEYSELKGLPNNFFADNRKRCVENFLKYAPEIEKNSVLLLKGGDELPNYDTDTTYYYFQQEGNIYYLSGVLEPGIDAAIDLTSSELTLLYDEPPESHKIWSKVLSTEELGKKYDCRVIPKQNLPSFIREKQFLKILRLKGNGDNTGLPLLSFEFNFKDSNDDLNALIQETELPFEVIKYTRSVKSEDEIRLMQYVCDISMYAHCLIQKNCKPGINERDLESGFMNVLRKEYYTRIWGYPCISCCGCHSAILHYEKNDTILKDGDLFLADMGIRFNGYVSDITCTFPVNGKFTKKQKEIYDIVLKSNRETMSILKPGVSVLELNRVSKTVILKELQLLGLIKADYTIEELFEKKIQNLFMPHSLGHFLGIDVHDHGRVIAWRKELLLEKGNIYTVEPGIYFVEYALENAFKNEEIRKYLNEELIRTYFGFGGVRIEDDVLVTEDGFRNLTEKLPRTTEEIEDLMKK